ncbi:ribosome biogenesis regulatory protein-domain-containing protein [Hysterangium stoloniferum]|nr:ribosome biogenesis regulatory protein-domain-containing protein [Hysterangium stoloniferum]
MDVSSLIAIEQSKHKSIVVEKEIPLEVDAGLLTVTDLNLVDQEAYEQNREELLLTTARDGCQVLITSLFALPVQATGDGPLAKLPPTTTLLPRSKPLPKPKPPTKWEQFAAAKGIQKTRKDKKVFDEEKQEWVNRWGKDGKNREKEDQWITELPDNADPDFDPVKAARDERKARVAKNEKQKARNLEQQGPKAPSKEERKGDIARTLATTRVSTASMGKFDKKLNGESKLRGVKRKFDANEVPADAERKASLALVSKLDGNPKRSKHTGEGDGDILNVRKAIRSVNRGKGSASLPGRPRGGKTGGNRGRSKR